MLFPPVTVCLWAEDSNITLALLVFVNHFIVLAATPGEEKQRQLRAKTAEKKAQHSSKI